MTCDAAPATRAAAACRCRLCLRRLDVCLSCVRKARPTSRNLARPHTEHTPCMLCMRGVRPAAARARADEDARVGAARASTPTACSGRSSRWCSGRPKKCRQWCRRASSTAGPPPGRFRRTPSRVRTRGQRGLSLALPLPLFPSRLLSLCPRPCAGSFSLACFFVFFLVTEAGEGARVGEAR